MQTTRLRKYTRPRSSTSTIGSLNGLYQVDINTLWENIDCSKMNELRSDVERLSIRYNQVIYEINGFSKSIDSLKRAFNKIKSRINNRQGTKMNPITRALANKSDRKKIKELTSVHVELKKQLYNSQLNIRIIKKELRLKSDRLEECIVKVRMSTLH